MSQEDAIYAEIGRRIKQHREAAGLTQASLAIQVGLARSSVTNIENGIQRIQVDTLYAVARALAIEPAVLMAEGVPILDEEQRTRRLIAENRILIAENQALRKWRRRVLAWIYSAPPGGCIDDSP